jgi:DNA-binding transcriptional MerR regulator
MNQAWITTREAAERLQVHARTVRKWIDTFAEYICPDWNERGHYVLNEESLRRLVEIKNRLQTSGKSMRQVKEELLREGKMTPLPASHAHAPDATMPVSDSENTLHHLIEGMEHMGEMMEELFDRMDRLENHMYGLFESLEDMEHQLTHVSHGAVRSDEVQQMFDEIRKKQDQLRMELRNVTFTHRLTAATAEQGLVPRRQKRTRFFGIF